MKHKNQTTKLKLKWFLFKLEHIMTSHILKLTPLNFVHHSLLSIICDSAQTTTWFTWESVELSGTCVSGLCQDLATAERLRRQIQTEKDELQEEVKSSNTKKYEPNDNSFCNNFHFFHLHWTFMLMSTKDKMFMFPCSTCVSCQFSADRGEEEAGGSHHSDGGRYGRTTSQHGDG